MRSILLLFISLVVGGCSCSQLSTTVCSIDSIAVYINDTLYIAKPFVSKDISKEINNKLNWSNIPNNDLEWRGKVYIEFTLTQTGRCIDIKILTRTNSKYIDTEIVRCIRRIKYNIRYRSKHKVKVFAIVDLQGGLG